MTIEETKWRGIKTTQEKKNEAEPKTKLNRFKQKTLSLPRIDDKKRWAGYPGVTGISRKLAKLVSHSEFYVEPFAGTGKVFQELIKRGDVKVTNFILNDTAPFIYNWLKKEFPEAIITNLDFVECIKIWDSEKTFFLIDPVWFEGSYKQDFSSFNRESVLEYEKEIISLCSGKPFTKKDGTIFNKEEFKIKGKFIITTRKESRTMLNSGFTNTFIISEYVVCGNYPRVLITTNLTDKELFPKKKDKRFKSEKRKTNRMGSD